MGIARYLLNKVDKIMDNVYDDDNYPRSLLKAAGAGVIEGFVDGALVVGLIGMAYDVCKRIKK